MKDFPIPVHAAFDTTGVGSQPGAGDGFNYTPFPRDVPTFSMPQVPADADAASMAAARQLLVRFVGEMKTGSPRLEVTGLADGVQRVLNETLGEGEVSVRIIGSGNGDGAGGGEIRIQETVFAGLWRERYLRRDGELLHDFLHACAIPPVVIERAQRSASTHLPAPAPALPRGVMNAPALLTEIRERVQRFKPQQPPHVINLTLLPLTPEDQALLAQALPVGPVAILSRGFGNCRITSTALRDLWRVQYFNSMQTLILNTLEVAAMPEVAMAAAEDLADSRERLAELIEWMGDSANA